MNSPERVIEKNQPLIYFYGIMETVKKHIHNIYDKLHVQTRTEALNKDFQR